MWNEMKTKKMYAFSCIHESIELCLFFSNVLAKGVKRCRWSLFAEKFIASLWIIAYPQCNPQSYKVISHTTSIPLNMGFILRSGELKKHVEDYNYAEAGFIQTYPSQLPTGLGTATNITLGISCASWCKFVTTVYLVLSKSLWWKLHRCSWLGFKPGTSYILVQMP